MIINEILTRQSNPQEELDAILAKCCELVLNGQEQDADFYGMVGACVVMPNGNKVYGVSYHDSTTGKVVHAERAALDRCDAVDADCIMVTTLSPCNERHDETAEERYGESCEDLIANSGIQRVYCGYKDFTQDHGDSTVTENPKLHKLCKRLSDTFLKEDVRVWEDGVAEGFLNEGLAHPVIVVDVQPEYSGMNDGNESSVFPQIINFVNKQTGPVLMFVNAEDQGMSGDTIQDIKQYWDDTICPEEERYTYDEETDDYIENPNCPKINWQRFAIADKGYGYFRSWMDHGIEPATIVATIRELYQQKKSDSRELQFPAFNRRTPQQSLIMGAMQEMGDDPISVDWTSVSQLKRFNGAYIVGGARDQCLREVELLMNAFNIKYKRIDSLIYEGQQGVAEDISHISELRSHAAQNPKIPVSQQVKNIIAKHGGTVNDYWIHNSAVDHLGFFGGDKNAKPANDWARSPMPMKAPVVPGQAFSGQLKYGAAERGFQAPKDAEQKYGLWFSPLGPNLQHMDGGVLPFANKFTFLVKLNPDAWLQPINLAQKVRANLIGINPPAGKRRVGQYNPNTKIAVLFDTAFKIVGKWTQDELVNSGIRTHSSPEMQKQAGQAAAKQQADKKAALNQELDDLFLENFANGKKPGRKGLAKRSGVNTKASVSSLRKTAKHSTGEKARMAHWLANMKAGRAKKK